ncbi:hypothetical protein LZ32DRAFT_654590 [Colletotrichum eremochloae]|nr:hypothetical protein LZ32DRAFT_654590 [Colletotrichum eremochloae]
MKTSVIALAIFSTLAFAAPSPAEPSKPAAAAGGSSINCLSGASTASVCGQIGGKVSGDKCCVNGGQQQAFEDACIKSNNQATFQIFGACT